METDKKQTISNTQSNMTNSMPGTKCSSDCMYYSGNDNVNPKLKSVSKFFNSDSSSIPFSQDNKLMQIKSLKASFIKFPIAIHKDKTGTFQGFAGYSYKNNRKVNEDKLDININYTKGTKHISLFSIYDGHGGDTVSSYLKDKLHKELIASEQLLLDPKRTILNIYDKVERSILMMPHTGDVPLGGACALLLMTTDNTITIANLGDSRGIISLSQGEKIHSISIDHKLSNETEKQRVISLGGVIKRVNQIDRVFPGGLSVSRSFGDSDIKFPQKIDKNIAINAIISVPDIFFFEYKPEMDFILLGSDGVFESLTNKEIVLSVYFTLKRSIEKSRPYDKLLEKIIYKLNKKIIFKGIKDNLTCLFLPFEGFKLLFESKSIEAVDKVISSLKSSQLSGGRLYEAFSDSYLYQHGMNIVSSPSGGFENKKKSTLLQTNIRLYENSFTKSNISIEGKRSNSHLKHIDESEGSDCSKLERKQKESKNAMNCCGLFAFV